MAVCFQGASTIIAAPITKQFFTGTVVSSEGNALTLEFPSSLNNQLYGPVELSTYANGFEYVARGQVIQSKYRSVIVRLTSEVQYVAIAENTKLLSQPLQAKCFSGGNVFVLNLVAKGETTFAFESENWIPSSSGAQLMVKGQTRTIKMPVELVLQRSHSGIHRGMGRILNFDRLASMHWKGI